MRLYTTDEKLALLDEWKASGLSGYAFAAGKGIPQSTFSHWTRGENLTDRRNLEGRRKFAELREQGVTPWKIHVVTGMSGQSCRHWDRLWKDGKLGV